EQIALSNGRFAPISSYQPVGFPPAFRNEMASAPPARSSRHRGSAPAAPPERIVATTAADSRAAFRFPACSGPLMGTKARIARPLERQAEVIGMQDADTEDDVEGPDLLRKRGRVQITSYEADAIAERRIPRVELRRGLVHVEAHHTRRAILCCVEGVLAVDGPEASDVDEALARA